jgi:hypothetical protein
MVQEAFMDEVLITGAESIDDHNILRVPQEFECFSNKKYQLLKLSKLTDST